MYKHFSIRQLTLLNLICFCFICFGCNGTLAKISAENTTFPVMIGPLSQIDADKKVFLNENMNNFDIKVRHTNKFFLGEQLKEKPEKLDVELLKIGINSENPVIISEIYFNGFFTYFESTSESNVGVKGALYSGKQ